HLLDAPARGAARLRARLRPARRAHRVPLQALRRPPRPRLRGRPPADRPALLQQRPRPAVRPRGGAPTGPAMKFPIPEATCARPIRALGAAAAVLLLPACSEISTIDQAGPDAPFDFTALVEDRAVRLSWSQPQAPDFAASLIARFPAAGPGNVRP